MSNPEYDEHGGIVSLEQKESEKPNNNREKSSYNLLEKLMLRFSPRLNYLLDKEGKYKCRREGLPKVLRIGPTNRCSAQCFYCPREHIHSRGSGYLDFALYERIIAWAKGNGVETVSFALFGEPLIHPRIFDMLDLAHQSGIGLRLSSNAIVMDEKTAERILDFPLEAMEMSLDGYNEIEYARGKMVEKYELAKKNIEYLLRRAKERGSKTKFNIHFVDAGNVSATNKAAFVSYWKEQLNGLNYETSFYYEPHNWAGTRSTVRADIGFLDRLLYRFELKKPCVYIKGLNIDWNGDVFICTNDPTDKAIIGNLNKNSVEEIYNGEKRLAYLDAHEKGDFRNLNCAVCTVNSYWPLLFIKKRIMNYLSK